MSKLFRECERCEGTGVEPNTEKDQGEFIESDMCYAKCNHGFVPYDPPADVQALARAVTDNVTQFGTEQNNVANMITAFIEAQKPEIPKDIQALARVCYNITKDFFYQDEALEAIAAEIAAFNEKLRAENKRLRELVTNIFTAWAAYRDKVADGDKVGAFLNGSALANAIDKAQAALKGKDK